MAIATWWTGDAQLELARLAGFEVQLCSDVDRIAALNQIDVDEVARRLANGHQSHIGSIDGTPATYGWVATRDVSLGELDLAFTLPARDRYLWDFGTLPAFRGNGMYPRLLAAIRGHERATADRLWIAYAPENVPSAVGIERAGFTTVGELSFDSRSRAALRRSGDVERARAAAQLFGVPLVEELLTTCWRCASGEGCGCRATGGACSCHVAPDWRRAAA